MQKIHTPHISDFDLLLSEMNQTILHKEMTDIIEVTYAYVDLGDGILLNKVLFGTFLSQDFACVDNKEIWKKVAENMPTIYYKTKEKLIQKKSQVIEYKQKLQPFLTKDFPKAQILYDTLSYISKIIDLTLTGLVFEGEKAGFAHHLSEDEIKNTIVQLEQIETSLFGGNVRENAFEVQGSYDFMQHLFVKNKDLLTAQEQEEFLSYLGMLAQKYNISISQKGDQFSKNSKEKQPDFLSRDISREDYVKIFQVVFSIYGLNKPVIVDERSSIYDSDDALYIPNSEAYTTLKLARVLALIQHEIETHYLISHNNEVLLGQFRGAGNLQREEGLAMQSENFLLGKNFDDLKVSRHIPDILMGEILPGEQYQRFMVILSKLKKEKNAKGNFIRRKRNYPLNFPGVQHKDTSYNRGEFKVVDFIKNGGEVKDLYLSKVSFEDIQRVKDILMYGDFELKYPLLIAELLSYFLSGKKLIEKEFLEYIERKYPFLDIKNEVSNKRITQLTREMKINIIGILEALNEEVIEKHYPRMLKVFRNKKV